MYLFELFANNFNSSVNVHACIYSEAERPVGSLDSLPAA